MSRSATRVVKRGQAYRKRRSSATREVVGFTTKPDGIRRARLVDDWTDKETRVRVDQFFKTYEPV